MGRRVLRRVQTQLLRRGSKKGLSRRHLEGRSTPFREYDPLGVCPIKDFSGAISFCRRAALKNDDPDLGLRTDIANAALNFPKIF